MSEEHHIVDPMAGVAGIHPVGEPLIEERPSNVPDTLGIEERIRFLEEEVHLLKQALGIEDEELDKAREKEHKEHAETVAHDAQVDSRLTPAQRDFDIEVTPTANQTAAFGNAHPGVVSHVDDNKESDLVARRKAEDERKSKEQQNKAQQKNIYLGK